MWGNVGIAALVVKLVTVELWSASHTGRNYTGGGDKSLAQPGRKQVTATEDFDVNISYLLS
jgi:hypothetical protein